MPRLLVALLTLAAALPARADPDTIPVGPREGTLRDFAGHRFTPNQLIADPFVDTSFASSTGAGVGTGNGHNYAITGVPEGETPVTLAGFDQAFAMQLGILSAVALRVSLDAQVYTGTDTGGSMNVGTTVQPQVGGGVTVPLPLGLPFQLSVVFEASVGPGFNLSLLKAIKESIDTGVLTGAVTTSTTVLIRPALVAAIPITKAFGAELSFDFQHQQTVAGAELTSNQLSPALVLDFDVGAVAPFRMALTAGYRPGFWLGDGGLRTHNWEFGVWYAGRKDLSLGGRMRISRTPLGNDVYLGTTYGEFVLSYFFD